MSFFHSQKHLKRRGIMFVLSSPSGAGKTSIARALLDGDPHLKLSVSVTTRPKRPAEINGKDYHFVTEEVFKSMIQKGELLEYARVFDNYYGTPKNLAEEYLEAGEDVLFDLDWQGTQQMAQICHQDLVSVFILPPSAEDLERRLRARAQDAENIVQYRMSKAGDEISHWAEYDYVVVNYQLEEAVAQVKSILVGERLRRERQLWLHEFVHLLREGL